MSDRQLWFAVVLLITLWGGAYALGSPPLAGGDEIMHVVKGTTVARGQLTGEPHPSPIEVIPVYGPEMAKYQMRQWLSGGGAECFRGQPEVVPTCFEYTGDPEPIQDFWYPDNKYQPLYYLAVGVPALPVSLGAQANHVMRLVSVLLSAMMLASALLSVRRSPGARVAALGLLVAMTPTVIATSAQVTPNNLEITAALACWATVLLVACEARRGKLPDRRVATRLAVTAAVLAVMRPASPGMLAAILLSGVVVAGWRPSLALLRHRRFQVAAAVIAGAVTFTVVWYVWKKPVLVGAALPESMDTWDVVRLAIGKIGEQFAVMVGAFGTPDYSAPAAMQVAWATLLGVLGALALLFGRLKLLLWAVALVVAALALQIGFDVSMARSIGPNWSAKYSLPLTVGIPLVLAFAAGERGDLLHLGQRRLRAAFALVVIGVQVAALWQFMRRYAVGYSGPVWFWTQPLWTAPLPGLLLLAAGIVGCAGTVLLILAGTERDGDGFDESLVPEALSPARD